MRDVVVLGVGMVPFRRYRDCALVDYGRKAVAAALGDAGVALPDVDVVMCGARDVGLGPGGRVLQTMARTTAPIVNVEAASATGAVAFREAMVHVAGGFADIALAVGVGKHGTPVAHLGGSEAGEQQRVRAMGVLPAAGEWAMELQRRELETGRAEEACVAIAVKAHQHAALNPNAHRNRPVTADEVRAARMVCEPLTVYHCCPASDGAAAAILASADVARRAGLTTTITIAASEFETHPLARDRRQKSVRTSRRAYERAGVGPEEIDVVSAYDSFSIEELVQYEDLGFAGDGEAEELALSGATRLGGRIPFNTDGGNLARGHAIGPTGLAQIHELVLQLRGTAGPRQVDGARTALAHHLGASGESLTHILRRETRVRPT